MEHEVKTLNISHLAGLNWYRANISLRHLALTEAPSLPKLKVPIMGIWSSHDYFLTEEQMKASEQ